MVCNQNHNVQHGYKDIDGLMQKRRNSIALAMDLGLFCIKPNAKEM